MVDPVRRPLAHYRFHLTLDDALAGERLHGEWSSWRLTVVIVLAVGVGGGSALLEEWLATPWWLNALALALLAFAGLSGWDRLRDRRRAARASGEWEVDEWHDHLAVRSPAGEYRLANEMVGNVVAAADRVFVLHEEGMVILPRRAFVDDAAMAAFAEALDMRSRDAAP